LGNLEMFVIMVLFKKLDLFQNNVIIFV
jgi:hypothetical protein